MKLKMIINFKKGKIPIKLRMKHFLLSAFKTMGGVTSFYIPSFGAAFYN